MIVRTLGLALALAVAAHGCSNPKCWTHDPEEVAGGCSLFPSSGGGGGDFDGEAYQAHQRRQLDTYDDACRAGDPIACWMVGDAQVALTRPASEIEASYAVACCAGLRTIPGRHVGPCRLAGDQARLRGDSGKTAALGHYRRGCTLGDALACELAFELEPAPARDFAIAACGQRVYRGCERAVAIDTAASGPADPAATLEVMRRGCALGSRDLCIQLGQREVGR